MIRPYRVLPAADRDLDYQAACLAAEASLETALRFYDAASTTFGKIASVRLATARERKKYAQETQGR